MDNSGIWVICGAFCFIVGWIGLMAGFCSGHWIIGICFGPVITIGVPMMSGFSPVEIFCTKVNFDGK